MKKNWERIRKAGPMALFAAFLGLFGASAAAAYFMDIAFAASPPPAPSITSSPSNPTTSTSASFTYKDSQSGVTFKCALDTSTFTTCPTSISYSSLAQGSHTFKVEAASTSATSTATSYSWSIVPPTPTITSEPSSTSTSTSATFKYSDSLAGVSYECSLDASSFSSCPTSGITYTISAGGSHTFSVEAQVGSNTPSAAASDSFTVTTPTPTINSAPTNPVASSSATFKYSDSQSGATFKCELDTSGYSACASSGVTYTGLADGTHTFSIKGQLGSGTASTPASYSWRVDTTAPSINLIFPNFLGIYNATNWGAGCSPIGICGTASDPSGVSNVSVAILQWETGDYWNGHGFTSSSQLFNSATGTTSWNYPFTLPAGGIYTVFVKATDGLGNSTPAPGLIESTFLVNSGKAATITESSGSPQSASVHSAFGAPLVAKVTDSGGNPVSGATVTFTAPTSGATGTFATCSGGNPTSNECEVTTNSSGLATSSVFTANTVAGGPYTVAATTSGVSGTANFSLTNKALTATQLAFSSGAVSGPASSSATLGQITVQLEDTYGNPVAAAANTTVNLSSTSTGGVFATVSGGSPVTSVTISSGSTSTSFYYGDSHAGSPKITAASGTLTSATQTESIAKASPTVTATGPSTDNTGSPIAASAISSVLSISSGPNSSGTITIKVFGPLPSAPTACTTGGTSVGTAAVSGNATYHPSVGYTPTAAGNYWWYASYNGDANNNAAVSVCGSAMSQTVVSGSAATKLVITTSPVSGSASNSATLGPIVCQVESSSGSAVNVTANTTVTLSSSSTGGIFAAMSGATPTTTVTINAGSSSTSFYYGDTKAGSPTITASASPLTAATQIETITAGTANSITIVSGSPQSAQAGAAFGSPLVVQVSDTWGNPVGSANVTFSAPVSGASGTFSNSTGTVSTSTGSNGQASSGTFTANTVAGGPYNVSASTSGPAPVNFVLTNTPGPASKLVFTTEPSTNQNVAAGTAVAIKVAVEDAHGNTESGDNATTVSLAIGTNPASGTLNCAGSNTSAVSAGVASFSCSINKAGNGYTLSATSNPAHGTVVSNSFNIVAGQPASITVVTGSNQSATQGSAFSNPLVAQVNDADGNPVSGATVTFTAPSSGASGTFSNSSNTISAPTGSNGQVSEVITANHTGAVYYSVTASVALVSSPATFVDLLNGGNFTVNGPSGLAPLLPGKSEPLNVVITNPNPESITIGADAITGSVTSILNGDSNGSLAACSITWFSIGAGPGGASITIPAGTTESLSQLSVPQADWPVLSMTDVAANQDNCAGATLNLGFVGTASGS